VDRGEHTSLLLKSGLSGRQFREDVKMRTDEALGERVLMMVVWGIIADAPDIFGHEPNAVSVFSTS
jgi:hypothetical protein